MLLALLVTSGSVHVNPGPPSTVKKLSFAIWNLDSLPARNFARIPLIESLQSECNFDLFGICESMLNENISNEDIFINGFSPDPLMSDNHLLREMGVFVYISKNPYLLRKDLILKSCPKL